MADDIKALSAALAKDPASLVYVELAEALRRRGKLAEAEQVVLHGLGRHSEHADGFDSLARIHADRGHMDQARTAWERALAIAPEHGGALRGIGFLFYRQGDTNRAIDALDHAMRANPGDEAARRALASLRGETAADPRDDALDPRVARAAPAAPAPPARAAQAAQAMRVAQAASRAPVFEGLEGATADMLLLDARGLVLAGGLKGADGSDASELAAAALAGVSGEASRSSDYLGIGAWTTIVAEAEAANVVLAPVGEGSLLMLRRDVSTPVGMALRVAERAKGAAAMWLEAHS